MDGSLSSIAQILGIIKDLSLGTAAVFLLVGGYRGWWVYGWIYREIVKDRDEWRTDARRNMGVAKDAVSHVVKGSNQGDDPNPIRQAG